MSAHDYHCPPYAAPVPYRRTDGLPPTILELAARASSAASRYRRCMDDRAPFRDTLSAAGTLARTTEELCTAIADSVACGDGRITGD